MATTNDKLSRAMKDALSQMSQSGGHGHGRYAYLATRTAEALERRGLVVLGWRNYGKGTQMPWGIAVGAEEPYDFASKAEIRRQWDEFGRRQRVRADERRAVLVERVRESRAARGVATDAEWENRLNAAIDEHGCAVVERALDADEAERQDNERTEKEARS